MISVVFATYLSSVNPKFGQPNQGLYLEICEKCSQTLHKNTIKQTINNYKRWKDGN